MEEQCCVWKIGLTVGSHCCAAARLFDDAVVVLHTTGAIPQGLPSVLFNQADQIRSRHQRERQVVCCTWHLISPSTRSSQEPPEPGARPAGGLEYAGDWGWAKPETNVRDVEVESRRHVPGACCMLVQDGPKKDKSFGPWNKASQSGGRPRLSGLLVGRQVTLQAVHLGVPLSPRRESSEGDRSRRPQLRVVA